MQQGSRWYFFWLTSLFLSLFRHNIFCGHSESHVAPHKREIRPQRGKKGGVEEQEQWKKGGREALLWDTIYDWIPFYICLKSKWMQDKQVAAWERNNPTTRELVSFFVSASQPHRAAQPNAVRGANWGQTTWGHSWANQFTSIRFDLLRYKLICSCSVHFSSVQAEPASCRLFRDTKNSKIIQVFCRDHRKWRSPARDTCSASKNMIQTKVHWVLHESTRIY